MSSCSFGNSTNYDNKNNTFIEKRWISLEGKIDRKRMSRRLLIGINKTGIDGLPISVHITAGPPEILENARKEQTRITHTGPKPAFIQQYIGYFMFAPAWKDEEQGKDHPDSLYAEIQASEFIFNDLWAWVRFGMGGEPNMSLTVFGQHMQNDPQHSFSSAYQWDVGEDAMHSLLISEFAFSVANNPLRQRPNREVSK